MPNQKFRLVTRSDFDGLVCGMLLRELDLIDEIKFVHPKDMQDGTVPITKRDIITNLPYVDGCHLAFDHHSSEEARNAGRNFSNHVIDVTAPSAARVVYRHFGATAFPRISKLTRRSSAARKSSTRKGGCCSTSSWILEPGLGVFATFGSRTTSS
jgi:oligoribonuclease NrnB/cAMP/cGMP phosphodiesterase (DHH superfamily)